MPEPAHAQEARQSPGLLVRQGLLDRAGAVDRVQRQLAAVGVLPVERHQRAAAQQGHAAVPHGDEGEAPLLDQAGDQRRPAAAQALRPEQPVDRRVRPGQALQQHLRRLAPGAGEFLQHRGHGGLADPVAPGQAAHAVGHDRQRAALRQSPWGERA